MLPPYRIPLYNRLVEDLGWDLTVLLGAVREEDREWDISLSDHKFSVKVLRGFHWLLRTPLSKSHIYHVHLNPGIIPELIRRDFDLLVLSGYGSLTAQLATRVGTLRHIPILLWVRSFHVERNGRCNSIQRFIEGWQRRSIRRANAYVVPGEKSRSFLQGFGVDSEHIRLIGNPVDNDLYKKDVSPDQLPFNTEKTVVLFVGRLVSIKGIDALLRAFQAIQEEELTFVIIGDGPLQKKVMEAKEKDSRIEYRRFVPHEELPRYYHAADLLVLPSTYEAWGLVINEAMNAGLPIITTTNVGAAGEIVRDGCNGYVIAPDDPDAIYEKILELHRDPEKRRRMGQESRNIISEWGLDKAVNGFREAAAIAMGSYVDANRNWV
jgi:glycosyltransferase involved in cell wall biosynthesis